MIMKYTLWSISFLCLIIAAITGLGVGIGVLEIKWIYLMIFSVAGMMSTAEIAEKYYQD